MMTLSAPVNTLTLSLFLFSLKCTYNTLFVLFNFPKTLLCLFQGLSKGYRGWEENIHCYILHLRGKIKLKVEKGNGIFTFIKREDSGYKLRKKL